MRDPMDHHADSDREGGEPPRPSSPIPAPGGAGQFLRFCGVGGVGFAVDALALMACIHGLGLGPIPARLASAVVAILTTFELNRRWAFRGAGSERWWAGFAAYAGVQGIGLACNVAVYVGCNLLLPPPLNAPLICLAAASGAALLVNYAGASRVVFRPKAP